MTAHCSPRPSYSYFTVMIDHLGKRGMEAIVHPEETRRQIVDRLRHGDYPGSVVFIHFTDDLITDDVTRDLLDEAEALSRSDHFEEVRIDRQAAAFDHARDLRKHETA